MAAIGRIKGHLEMVAFTRRSSNHVRVRIVPDLKPAIGHAIPSCRQTVCEPVVRSHTFQRRSAGIRLA
jgi:hypothetical protein